MSTKINRYASYNVLPSVELTESDSRTGTVSIIIIILVTIMIIIIMKKEG